MLAAGIAIGASVAFAVRFSNPAQADEILMTAAAGAASGLAFWLSWRPIRDKPGSQMRSPSDWLIVIQS
jgi:hypothetical protein